MEPQARQVLEVGSRLRFVVASASVGSEKPPTVPKLELIPLGYLIEEEPMSEWSPTLWSTLPG
jgi:hypothetical protein